MEWAILRSPRWMEIEPSADIRHSSRIGATADSRDGSILRKVVNPFNLPEMEVATIPRNEPEDSRSARIALVEQHIQLENAHDLEAVLHTFGDSARYDDEAWGEHYKGANGVREFYEQLMQALPDLEIEVQRRHVAEHAILVEVMIRGTHLGKWRGFPPTGRRIEFPLCGVYTFDTNDRLAGEKIYYDRATVLAQLGVFHNPQSALGQICTFLTHPFTMARTLARNLFR
jgi:steroid delta-isomerase-like uncharacterized protein